MVRICSIAVTGGHVVKGRVGGHGVYTIVSQLLLDVEGVEDGRGERAAVERRYSDFVLLQDCLRANNSGLLVPPLPPPTIHLLLPSQELVAERVVLLQRFMDNVMGHEELAMDPSLWMFVLSPEADYTELASKYASLAREAVAIPSCYSAHRLQSGSQQADPLEDRLKYLLGIMKRLVSLRAAFVELFASQQHVGECVGRLSATLAAFLDASIDAEANVKFINLIESLDVASEMIREARGRQASVMVDGFIATLTDFINTIVEMDLVFKCRRQWKSVMYTCEIDLIDSQAALLKASTGGGGPAGDRASFDANYTLSECYLQARRASAKARRMVALLTARIGGELDRFDRMRMEKIEASLDGFLGDQLRMQKKIVALWEAFLSGNVSARSSTEAVSPG